MSGARPSILKAVIRGDLRDALNALETQLAEKRGPEGARDAIIRVTAAVATSKRDFQVRACVFLWAAAGHYGVDLLPVLVKGQASSRHLRRLFEEQGEEKAAAGLVSLTPNGICFEDDDTAYAVSYSHMPFLILYSSLIVNIARYDVFAAIRDSAMKGSTVAEIATTAKDFANFLNRSITPDFDTGHGMRKLQTIIDFMERSVGRDFKREQVDDQSVYEFWCSAIAVNNEGDGFVKYPSCVEVVERFLEMWEAGEAELEDVERDEDAIDAFEKKSGAFLRATQSTDEFESNIAPEISMVAMLAENDAVVRFRQTLCAMENSTLNCLTNEQSRLMQVFFSYSEVSRRLHLTRMRASIFGPRQAVLSAAIGRRVSDAGLAEKISETPKHDYAATLNKIDRALESYEQSLWAVAHILVANKRPEAVAFLLTLAESESFDRATLENIFDPTDGIDTLKRNVVDELTTAECSLRQGVIVPFLRPMAIEAERAYKLLSRSRKGFETNRLHTRDAIVSALSITEDYDGEAPELRRRCSNLQASIAVERFKPDFAAFQHVWSGYYGSGVVRPA